MARIPKYPYQVVVTSQIGNELRREWHNYETLPGALAYREMALNKRMTRKVELMIVIDESTPNHRDQSEADSLHANRFLVK